MITSLLAALLYITISGIGLVVLKPHRFASPVFWLPAAMALIALPTFALIDLSYQSDVPHLMAFLVAVCAFCSSAVLYQSRFPLAASLDRYGARFETPDAIDARVMALMLLVFTIIITIVYFYLVGYNLLFLLLVGTVSDYSAMRLSAYSGDSYFAPGYVNQFKNTLFPILAVAAAYWMRGCKPLWRWLFAASALGFGIFALLGTGQRVYILFAVFSTLYGLYLLRLGRGGLPLRLIGLVVVPTVLLFAFMTVAYKQIYGAGFADVVADISERFFRVQQEGGLIGFRIFAERESPLFGEWIKGWIGILPGREGSMVAHEVHGEMYGSTQGTVPLSAVGSTFLNGGLLAVALLYGALGLSYSYLFHRFLEGPRTVLRALSYGTLFFYLGTYVVGPPESLIDSGVVAVGGLLILRRIEWLPRWIQARAFLRGLNSQQDARQEI